MRLKLEITVKTWGPEENHSENWNRRMARLLRHAASKLDTHGDHPIDGLGGDGGSIGVSLRDGCLLNFKLTEEEE